MYNLVTYPVSVIVCRHIMIVVVVVVMVIVAVGIVARTGAPLC